MAVAIGIPKSCFRCGAEFRDFSDQGLARVCPGCKKPKAIQPPPPLKGKPLTVREAQVTALIVEGKLSKEIAHELHLGEGTIKQFVSTILAKTGMPNRTKLAVWWVLSHRKDYAEVK